MTDRDHNENDGHADETAPASDNAADTEHATEDEETPVNSSQDGNAETPPGDATGDEPVTTDAAAETGSAEQGNVPPDAAPPADAAPLGTPPPLDPVPAEHQNTGVNGTSIASIILGSLSFMFGFFTGIPAIITGVIGLKKIKKSGEAGRELAIIGIIFGTIGTILSVLALIGTLILAAKAFDSMNEQTNKRPKGPHSHSRNHNAPTNPRYDGDYDATSLDMKMFGRRVASQPTLPQSLPEAQTIFDREGHSKDTRLVGWVVRDPGFAPPMACFTVDANGMQRSGVVMTSSFRGRGFYRELPPSVSCDTAFNELPSMRPSPAAPNNSELSSLT